MLNNTRPSQFHFKKKEPLPHYENRMVHAELSKIVGPIGPSDKILTRSDLNYFASDPMYALLKIVQWNFAGSNSKGLSKSILAIGSSSVILERKKCGSDPDSFITL
jgi:hypothetical protein